MSWGVIKIMIVRRLLNNYLVYHIGKKSKIIRWYLHQQWGVWLWGVLQFIEDSPGYKEGWDNAVLTQRTIDNLIAD